MKPNILRLIIRPLIGGPRLQQQFLGMRAMPQQSRPRNQHRQNRNGQRNRQRISIILMSLWNLRKFKVLTRLFTHFVAFPFSVKRKNVSVNQENFYAVAGGCILRKRASSSDSASNFFNNSWCLRSSVSGFLAVKLSVPPGSRTHWRTSESESKPCLRAAAASSSLVISSRLSFCSWTFPSSIKTSARPSTS